MTDEPLDLSTIATEYATPEAAEAYFEQVRWPNGVACVQCGSVEVYEIKPKATSTKSRKHLKLWKCSECAAQFTVTVGTVFEGSHIALNKWLLALHLLCSSKKGMSAHQLHRMLKVTYKTAWFMAHRIRYAMEETYTDKLEGVIEADETYVGGRRKGLGHGYDNKIPVVTLVERGGRARSKMVSHVTARRVRTILKNNVSPDARIMTDTASVYWGVHNDFSSHETVNHQKKEYARGDVTTNTVEGYFATFKRGIEGVYHHVSEKHLPRYLAEFDFRYNGRKVEDGVRTLWAIEGAEGKRLRLQ